jgi:phenylacetate-CoA ligase
MIWSGLKYYLLLRSNLRQPLDVLQRRSWSNFCELVRYAYYHVPFYRRLYDAAGFSPEQLHNPGDLSKVPSTRKALFQQAELKDCLAAGHVLEKLVKRRTSGSSGHPSMVYYTAEDRIYRTLLHLRILFHNGMGMRDRMAHLSDKRNLPDFSYHFQKLGFLPKEFICVADPEAEQLRRLEQIKPDVIYSYASNMTLLAAEVENLGSCPIHPALIFTTGEALPVGDRERINRAFDTKLRDIYGLVEMGDVAWQCPQVGGYHLNVDSFLIEILADGQPATPGQPGKLVITNLHSRAMPFIRYEVDDVLTGPHEDPCPCGCTFPRVDTLQGRQDDWLYLPDGKRVSSMIFIVASVPGVKQYRIIQKALDRLVVEIVPGKDYTALTLGGVRDHLAGFMGPDMKIEVHTVDQIPRQSGKIRSVIQEVKGLPA